MFDSGSGAQVLLFLLLLLLLGPRTSIERILWTWTRDFPLTSQDFLLTSQQASMSNFFVTFELDSLSQLLQIWLLRFPTSLSSGW